jgi:hypothetical protein
MGARFDDPGPRFGTLHARFVSDYARIDDEVIATPFFLPSFLLSISDSSGGASTQSPSLAFVFSSKSREVLGVAALEQGQRRSRGDEVVTSGGGARGRRLGNLGLRWRRRTPTTVRLHLLSLSLSPFTRAEGNHCTVHTE